MENSDDACRPDNFHSPLLTYNTLVRKYPRYIIIITDTAASVFYVFFINFFILRYIYVFLLFIIMLVVLSLSVSLCPSVCQFVSLIGPVDATAPPTPVNVVLSHLVTVDGTKIAGH